MVPEDTLLDVACGSGEFAIFCAKRIKYVCGVDLSEKMIELAEAQVVTNKLNNIHFTCSDLENIPCKDNTFSIVVCKSAFHHFLNYDTVFSEMIRCCKRDCRISIQDIVSYDDNRANDFFERLEKDNEYVNHAVQSRTNLENISHLVDGGLKDQDISPYFTTINDELFFKRNIFLILGKK